MRKRWEVLIQNIYTWDHGMNLPGGKGMVLIVGRENSGCVAMIHSCWGWHTVDLWRDKACSQDLLEGIYPGYWAESIGSSRSFFLETTAGDHRWCWCEFVQNAFVGGKFLSLKETNVRSVVEFIKQSDPGLVRCKDAEKCSLSLHEKEQYIASDNSFCETMHLQLSPRD